MGRIIACATPVFFAMIAIEYFVGRARGRNNYRLNDAVNSLSLGVMSQVVGLFTRALTIGIYAVVFGAVAFWQLPADQWWVWLLGIVSYDFCYYWFHRVGHESALFWASHVVHHQSQEYNLSTALRQTSSSALLGWIFYLPMAIAGIPPEVFAVAAVVNLLYQYWIHTEQVGSLGWFDRWFSSPSNHRVHHAVNDRYIDRNYGGIFMAWDHLFGTFVDETERCVYGTRAPLDSWDPFWANFEVYADLARRSWNSERWRDKLLVWLMPPGWQPAAASGAHWHKPHFEVSQLRRYDPPMTRGGRWFTAVQFVAVLIGATALLWYSPTLSFTEVAAWSSVVLAVLWLTGAVMQGRLRIPAALAIEVASIALLVVALPARAESAQMPVVVDDPVVQQAVAAARTEFLAGQDFDRLQVTALVEDKDGRWLRGNVGGDELAYPASCVKLAFLVGAVHWCAAQAKGPDCLDGPVRPMIIESDNVATGVVVDAISGVPNGPVAGADVNAFIEKRRYTERVLGEAGLLGNQRLFTKTYPTNSGEEPAGLEELAWKQLGRNAMSTNLAANLMLAVQSGAIEPQATDYMRGLMRRPTFSGHSSLGGGLPAGSLHENKVGNAFDTLEDIVYAELPNGRRLIVAALSNGYAEGEAEPWDIARLNGFTGLLIARLGIADGLPAPGYPTSTSTDDRHHAWRIDAPADGVYEIAVWHESSPTAAESAEYVVEYAEGSLTTRLDQRAWGSRWIKLGDVRLARGSGTVTVSNAGNGRLDPGRLRVTQWPQQAAADSGKTPAH
jgi:sterol desaturase/sphingolipid hydroxylase (fatty acid hydroxylase superfamily)